MESQGFYSRPVLCPRRDILWPLFKGCVITTVGLVLVMYAFHFVVAARGDGVFWRRQFQPGLFEGGVDPAGPMHSKFAQFQYKTPLHHHRHRRRIGAVAARSERKRADPGIEIVAELTLGEDSLAATRADVARAFGERGDHQRPAYLSSSRSKTSYKTCELEGIEVWLDRRFLWHANFPRPLLRVARRSPAGLSHGAGNFLAGAWPSNSWISSARWCCRSLDGHSGNSRSSRWPIKLTSPGPVFFRQQRSGLNGAPFTHV